MKPFAIEAPYVLYEDSPSGAERYALIAEHGRLDFTPDKRQAVRFKTARSAYEFATARRSDWKMLLDLRVGRRTI